MERIQPTESLLNCIRRWHGQGFRFALDDFAFDETWNSLLPYASIVKVDISQISWDETLRHKRQLSDLNLLWLAERIETEEDYRRYLTAGFDLFQGYFFAKPTPIYGQKMHPSGLQLLRVMGELARAEREVFGVQGNIDRLVQIISDDPHLVVQLLKIANSSFYRSRTKIASIHQVILRFGLHHLKTWVVLFGLLEHSAIEHARLVLIRASVCEELAASGYYRGCDPSRAYLTGLLSGVDLLYEVEPQQFIAQLQIDDSIQAAVLSRRGELGRMLDEVMESERRLMQADGIDRISEPVLKAFQGAREQVSRMIQEVRG